MLRKISYISVTIITVVFFYPTAAFQAKLVQPAVEHPAQLTSHQEPVSKQISENSRDRIVINTRLVNLTVTVNRY